MAPFILLTLLLPAGVGAGAAVAVAAAVAGAACGERGGGSACAAAGGAGGAPGSEPEGLALLQVESAARPATRRAGKIHVDSAGYRDLVLQHVPYNFGHTIETVVTFGSGQEAMDKADALWAGDWGEKPATLEEVSQTVAASMRPGGEVWGHLNTKLFGISEVTGCPLYYTPGKYWPKALAEEYFGNRTIFGMLRDPYERLVAQVRGNLSSYGASLPGDTCDVNDVNAAVRKVLLDYIAGNKFAGNCTHLPQAEYFDMPYGINLAVDNRIFPESMNKVLQEHGYKDIVIETEDLQHVTGCNDVWAGDLDCETKALVKKVYARDFDLLCERFGYCDRDENACLPQVPEMCPPNLEEKRKTATYCG